MHMLTEFPCRLVGRHMKELALAVKPNSLETKLLKFAISCNAVGQVHADIRPPDHPINQLKDIEHDRFGYLANTNNPVQTAKTILRKRQQLLESISEPIEVSFSNIYLKFCVRTNYIYFFSYHR